MKIKPNFFKFYCITVLLIWAMMSANLLLGGPITPVDIGGYILGSLVLTLSIPVAASHIRDPKPKKASTRFRRKQNED